MVKEMIREVVIGFSYNFYRMSNNGGIFFTVHRIGRCEQSSCLVNLDVYQIESFDTTSTRTPYQSSGDVPLRAIYHQSIVLFSLPPPTMYRCLCCTYVGVQSSDFGVIILWFSAPSL